ncbi:phosphoribosylamine--glycine ligase [Blastococcus sp. PRF04-17]|uniref:phosphoribosylamine--glycine ligase n=1 Tax=Blastococcus sp. PRF04-17 TaxID=2933797 RepID=UPI001FF6E8DB|nr:phosphoribosylamine--glycine ligase [Blastococcus sp. PRF04-17]UOY00825.1 phosphoribosylamine--glycine ligase [Blastococcus sp. PRF04-17]
MRVLVIGSGAREHALCVALSSDAGVSALACAPGNAGTRALAEPFALDVADPVAVSALAADWRADLVVIGPEVPLVAGAVDAVRDAGIACFGPSRQAAQLEGSKSFAKHVMAAAGVPTARSWPVGGPAELETALDEVTAVASGAPYVVKDDGLAAGKGVLVTPDRDAAAAHGRAVLDAGHSVLVEEYLDGPEVSLFAVTDGTTVVPLVPAQDFKRRDDGDRGPNTGGMGAYAPLPWAPPGLVDEVLATVLQPTVDEMARRGETFSGLLYAGLALTSRGVRVVEFNARFGDPETQVVLPLLETPLAGLLHAAATGTLAQHPPLRWRPGSAVTVVVAAPGYPQAPRTGSPITGAEGEGVLHAGTAVAADGSVVSAGGRVLSVVGLGPDLAAARQAAYERVAACGWPMRTGAPTSRWPPSRGGSPCRERHRCTRRRRDLEPRLRSLPALRPPGGRRARRRPAVSRDGHERRSALRRGGPRARPAGTGGGRLPPARPGRRSGGRRGDRPPGGGAAGGRPGRGRGPGGGGEPALRRGAARVGRDDRPGVPGPPRPPSGGLRARVRLSPR